MNAETTASRLQSSMIWSPAVPAGTQAYVAFRKRFDLDHLPTAARLHLFADSRYLLWVNGEYLLRGPCRFNPKHPEFDTLDIAAHLRVGSNTLVVLVHHYPATNGRIMHHAPGLSASLEADGLEMLHSDPSWRCSLDTEYQPSPGAWSSIPDVIDGRHYPGDWTTPAFDDSTWQAAVAVDGNTWGKMHARSTPLPSETVITNLQIQPDGENLTNHLPIHLEASETRPWHYTGGFVGKWMWSPVAARHVWFKTVWSNAGFGIGKDCDLKVICDNRFVLWINGREIARSDDLTNGWTGKLDIADGDVIAIEAEDLENGDHSAGLFVSMIHGETPVLSTTDFLCTHTAPPEDWKTQHDRSGFTELSATNIHPAHQGADTGMQSIVIDLGHMAMTYPTIVLDADAGSVLQLQYALRYVNGKTAETYGVGTTYTARAGHQSFIAADQWCARYVTLTCLAGRVKILDLKMTERRYPFERIGRFQCSDPFLNQLWEMAVNTIECTSDDAYGSDARERNEWVQDAAKASFNTTRIATAGPGENGAKVYADPRLLRNVLRHAALSQIGNGNLLGTFPTDRGPEDPHYVIEDYNCQWVEALRTYHEATGDSNFVREMWPYLVRQMDHFLQRITPRGLLVAREYTSFDNPLAYITCEGANINAFFYQALRNSEALAHVLGEIQQAQTYAQAADALYSSFNQHFWNAEENAYHAGLLNDKRLAPTVHAQLLALQCNLVPDDRKATTRKWFLTHYKNPGGFHCGSNPDTDKMIAEKAGIDMPIMYYWAFSELYRIDTQATDVEAIHEMRRRWKHMVERQQDAGTLSEKFVAADGSGASESCHNYGAIPAYFLSSYVLGVRRDGPVWENKLIIEPRLADLTCASGIVVTEYGPVPVRMQIHQEALQFSCTVPAGITATLRLPYTRGTVTLDGHAQDHLVMAGRYVILPLSAGHHKVIVGEKHSMPDF